MNTLFGYVVGVGVFSIADKYTNIFIIGFMANLITISFSYITNRYLVFESKEKSVLKEYLKYCTSYGIAAVFGMIALWILIDVLEINIWFAQGIIISMNVILMYLSNSKYIFINKNH